jgi:GNAT superfamily N-acetyltransferase
VGAQEAVTTPESLQRYTADAMLRDGKALRVRAIRPDDKQALQDGLHRLSLESSYFRFFRPKHDLSPAELVYLTEVDFDRHVALVAIADDPPLVVGVGRYIVCDEEPSRVAEIAFAVDDAHQGLGIATILLRHLAGIARTAGVVGFRARVLAENRKMLEVFSHSGLPQRRTRDGTVVDIEISLEETARVD